MKKIIFLSMFILLLVSFSLAVECTDTDNGRDLYVKGTTTGQEWGRENTVTKTDYCLTEGEKSGRLAEYACFDNQVHSITYGPEDGCIACEDGACIGEHSVECSSGQCERNGKCYNLGDRIGKSSFGEYCAEGGRVKMQLSETSFCSFDYECMDNLCYRGICMQRISIFSKIVDWLKSFF